MHYILILPKIDSSLRKNKSSRGRIETSRKNEPLFLKDISAYLFCVVYTQNLEIPKLLLKFAYN
jgi:hypothetical protein